MTERPPDFPTHVAAAIFDFDETLIDLEPQHTFAYDALCRDLGDDYQRMPESFRTGSGRRIIDDIHELKAFFGWTGDVDALFEQRQRHFEESCRTSELELMPGAESLVRALAARGVTLAITTSAVRGPIEEILARFGLRELFARIVDGSEVKRGKPDPEAYLVTAKLLGAKPADCVVFEDSTVGVLAAKRAGTYCIAVPNPKAQTPQDLSPANLVVRSLADVDAGWFVKGEMLNVE